MGLRYRKSVRICKGVRVNFSKSGASVSVGGRGHTVNFSNKGTKTTIGIPGTGLSYSTVTSNRARGTARSHVQIPDVVHVVMDERGKVTFQYKDGRPITDAATIRQIKSQPHVKMQIEGFDVQRRAKINECVRISEEENECFVSLYQLTPRVKTATEFEHNYQKLCPETYVKKKFATEEPSQEKIRTILEEEAQHEVKASIFKIKKLRRQYVEENLPQRYENAMREWQREKAVFEAEQEKEREAFEMTAKQEWEHQRVHLREQIDGKEEVVCQIFDEWIAACELPVQIDVDYDWNRAQGVMLLDVDLPEIEDLPTVNRIKTDAGNLKEKKKTQTQLREEYARVVFGLAMVLSAGTFNVSPAIKGVLISGYTQRRNRDGDVKDDYIYSIQFGREYFAHIQPKNVDPVRFCLAAECRCSMTSTSLFRAIQPFESFANER